MGYPPFNRVFYSRAKGKNKSGKAAGICAFEGLAPCRFDHWAEEGETYEFLGEVYPYAKGEPVGRMVQMPQILCLATAEGRLVTFSIRFTTTAIKAL